LDVDLASSTRTCLKYLYPQIVLGGILFSEDGDFPLVIEVFNNDEFWQKEVGYKKPYIEGLGKSKLIKIVKAMNGLSGKNARPRAEVAQSLELRTENPRPTGK